MPSGVKHVDRLPSRRISAHHRAVWPGRWKMLPTESQRHTSDIHTKKSFRISNDGVGAEDRPQGLSLSPNGNKGRSDSYYLILNQE